MGEGRGERGNKSVGSREIPPFGSTPESVVVFFSRNRKPLVPSPSCIYLTKGSDKFFDSTWNMIQARVHPTGLTRVDFAVLCSRKRVLSEKEFRTELGRVVSGGSFFFVLRTVLWEQNVLPTGRQNAGATLISTPRKVLLLC